MTESARSTDGSVRPLALFGIAVTGVFASAALGAITNAVNGWVSPLYFVTILRWRDVEDVWRASIAQEPGEAFERVRSEIGPTMTAELAAWVALEQFWRPAIAVFSASAEAWAAARTLQTTAATLADHHELPAAKAHSKPTIPLRVFGISTLGTAFSPI